MARKPRYLPKGGAVVEVTQRTIQGRFLLKPSQRFNSIVVGCLARAQKIYTGVQVHAVAVLSTHIHLLASFETVKQMSGFMGHFSGNLSKEIGKLRNWQGTVFDKRYHHVPLSDEPEAQIARLKYILSQGAKEGLVLSPKDWPGVHAANALLDGQPLRGTWIDRTLLYRARQRHGRRASITEATSEEKLHLVPLPCLAHLTPERQRAEVAAIIELIEDEVLLEHRRNSTKPVGSAAVLNRSPHDRTSDLVRSPKPLFHAFRKSVRTELVNGLQEFLVAYRRAAELLAAGARNVVFPENCFPPGLPFVPPAVAITH